MYIVKYGDLYLHDPLFTSDVIFDASSTCSENENGSFDFTIHKKHSLWNKLEARSSENPIVIYNDDVELFRGYISNIDESIELTKSITCCGDLGYLGSVLIRPFSTVSGEQPLTAPSYLGAFFNWVIERYNEKVDDKKRFHIGVNQASELNKGALVSISSSSCSTAASIIQSNILETYGGFLYCRYENGLRYIDLYSNINEINSQIIDFGRNILDFSKSTSYTDFYNTVVAYGATPEGSSFPISLSSLPDNIYSKNYGYSKVGDRVFDIKSVEKYGYVEYEYSDSEISDASTLLDNSVTLLEKNKEPSFSLEIKAIDLSLFTDGYKNLKIGELVRVRAEIFDVDQYMVVTNIDYDFDNPENTEYTLGYINTDFVKSLNSSINKNADQIQSTKKLTEEAKSTATEAKTSAASAQITANAAAGAAQTAQETADDAQTTADEAKTRAENTYTKSESDTKVSEAKTEAIDEAETLAATAKTEAISTATTLADTAEANAKSYADTKSDEAKKVATNYLKYDETDGLVVGKITDETLGANTQICVEEISGVDKATINLRDGTTELAKFRSDGITLGNTSGFYAELDSDDLVFHGTNSETASLGFHTLLGGSTRFELTGGENIFISTGDSDLRNILLKSSNIELYSPLAPQGGNSNDVSMTNYENTLLGISAKSIIGTAENGMLLNSKKVLTLPNVKEDQYNNALTPGDTGYDGYKIKVTSPGIFFISYSCMYDNSVDYGTLYSRIFARSNNIAVDSDRTNATGLTYVSVNPSAVMVITDEDITNAGGTFQILADTYSTAYTTTHYHYLNIVSLEGVYTVEWFH